MDYNDYYNSALPVQVVWQSFLMPWSTYVDSSGYDLHSIVADPVFVSQITSDFQLAPESPCIDAGTFLTSTCATGTGVSVPVCDARYFSDGMGLIPGDRVRVADQDSLEVVAVDYVSNVLMLDRIISWNSGDGVSYPHLGSAPDMGAHEFDPISIGDVNEDGRITSADIVYLVNYVFKGGTLSPEVTGDTNCNGQVTSTDIVVLVNFVFKSGAAPCST